MRLSSVSWDIIPLYVLAEISYTFNKMSLNFTWAVESLKFCTLMGSFCPNHIKFQLKNYLSWHWRVMQNLKKKTHLWFHKWQQFGEFRPEHSKFSKLPHGFKYEMRNLMSFHPTTQTSENLFSMGSFCPKYTWFEQQKYRGVIFHDTEQWCKIWINPDLVVSQMAWGIGWTFIRAQKSLKNCTLMDSFCPKHIMFQLENSIGIMCHNTEGWCTI